MEISPRKITSARNLIVPGDRLTTLHFAVHHFLEFAKDSIERYGKFVVALSGGSTPNAIYASLEKLGRKIDWSKVHLFWGDERSVPPDHPDSNYRAAMQAGLKNLPIPKRQIHRMVAEKDIEIEAEKYEVAIKREAMGSTSFDLVMLGIGEDGHIASLFPDTEGLHEMNRWVIANYVPQKRVTRMTITYPCIQAARSVVIYAMGKSKQPILSKVLHSAPNAQWPASQIGTDSHPVLWIVDREAIATY
ncbi:MAG: 6-phosphogluconolactonase [Chlamydiales bacterium]